MIMKLDPVHAVATYYNASNIKNMLYLENIIKHVCLPKINDKLQD